MTPNEHPAMAIHGNNSAISTAQCRHQADIHFGPTDRFMTGTWKEEGSAATITWDTGWITMISKSGDKYTKTAFKKGEPKDGKPANTSPAEKVK